MIANKFLPGASVVSGEKAWEQSKLLKTITAASGSMFLKNPILPNLYDARRYDQVHRDQLRLTRPLEQYSHV